ncbi:MAG: glycosyltransferase family 2 protein [Planctomycetes bacterium]|nr:glycosyltransferase family 2 protein [Planctomycetota bacterium]MBL7043792.1 glycosyltransferase family 2 protein [Pirellulaceae bacterium]
MTHFSIVVFWVLLGLIVAQGVPVVGYLCALRRFHRKRLDDEDCPKAAVILCVRGADPFLKDCLAGLSRQDYPQYEVHVVVDCQDDPAWELVEQVAKREEAAHVRVHALTERRRSCSLKISGVLQAVAELDESHRIVALLDSDTVPHPSWLRELVAPLADDRVGVSSGNRWYMPQQMTWGSLVRYLWNSAAVVHMYWYGIAWGGSLATRTSLLRETDLLQRLGHAFGEDSTICRCARRERLRVAFVPSLTMVNREVCSVSGFFHFLQRQLLTVRLHNPWWWAVVGHGIATSAALATGFVVLAAALVLGCWEAVGCSAAALALYYVSMIVLMVMTESCVKRIVLARNEPARWLTPGRYVRLALAIPLTQVVYAAGLTVTLFARRHRWRGVLYLFGAGSRVRVVDDRPYEPEAGVSGTMASL